MAQYKNEEIVFSNKIEELAESFDFLTQTNENNETAVSLLKKWQNAMIKKGVPFCVTRKEKLYTTDEDGIQTTSKAFFLTFWMSGVDQNTITVEKRGKNYGMENL